MATGDANQLWSWLAEQARSRGKPVRLRAHFSADAEGKTPVTLILRDGEPMAEPSPEARALFDRIDPQAIASRYVDPAQGTRWLERFQEARHETLLTPHAACRLLFGPYYRPGRAVQAFNANVELRVDPHDAAEWFAEIDPADATWPSLSDLAERLRGDEEEPAAPDGSRSGEAAEQRPAVPLEGQASPSLALAADRPDANRIALAAVRAVLGAAAPFDLTVEGRHVKVTVARLPAERWFQGGISGLDPVSDGPLPGAVRATCRWEGGEVDVVVSAARSNTTRHRNLLSIQTRAFGRQIVWTTVAAAVRDAVDGALVPVSGSCALFTIKDEVVPEEKGGLSRALKKAVARSGLPPLSESRVRLFDVNVPSGDVLPSPSEAFQRIVHLTLLKTPFFVREGADGQVAATLFAAVALPVEQGETDEEPASAPSEKLAGLYPLPGGVRQYRSTLDAVLAWFGDEPRQPDDFLMMLKERYQVSGQVSGVGHLRLLQNLGFVEERADGSLELSQAGLAYLAAPDAVALFERLHRTFSGVLETLVITGELGTASPASTKRILEDVMHVDWKTPNQTAFRRNWLLSLGLTDRKARGDVLTARGREVLRQHAAEVSPMRADVAAILAVEPDLAIPIETEDEESVEEEPDAGAAPVANVVRLTTAPPSWDADRLDLRPAMLDEHLAGLRMPSSVLEQACAALSAGKHLLLVGPPGNGKTRLALSLANAARAENYCHGAFLATASADWTTFDTIGGYALEKDSALRFRAGVFLAAVERWQWLLIDELNRADVDRAFGELMTVLAGGTSDTAYQLPDGRSVSVGSRATCSHRLPKTFRVIATMNTWDKTSLFRLSYAAQRRFAIIHVGIPDDATYAALIDHHGDRAGFDEPLQDGAKGPLKLLFKQKGLLGVREIGPAILEDIVAYMRRRRASGDGLAEAIAMYLLPQLEGLEQEKASAVFRKVEDALTGWTSAEALGVLRANYREIFPHIKLPEP